MEIADRRRPGARLGVRPAVAANLGSLPRVFLNFNYPKGEVKPRMRAPSLMNKSIVWKEVRRWKRGYHRRQHTPQFRQMAPILLSGLRAEHKMTTTELQLAPTIQAMRGFLERDAAWIEATLGAPLG